jgi:ribosomal protein S18 acetylase RimI-like enzyme
MTEPNLRSYEIRNATPSDLAVVRQISADAYISAYVPILGYIPKPAEEDYAPRIALKEVWLLERNGCAVGVAVLEEQPDHLLVYSIAVDPREQRQGYGRALLAFADQRAVAIGVPETRLYTNTQMKRNVILYQSHGYVAIGNRPHPTRAGEMLVDMARPVTPRAP